MIQSEHDVPKVGELALNHSVQIEKVELAGHSGTIIVPRDVLAMDNMNIPAGWTTEYGGLGRSIL